MTQKRKILYTSIAILILLTLIIFIFRKKSISDSEHQFCSAKTGKFRIEVVVSGELEAENSILINAPDELKSSLLRIGEVKITDLAPEGTIVKKGDYIGTLDPSEAYKRLKELSDEIEKNEMSYIQKQLDTSLSMRTLKNELLDLKSNLEESQLQLEQSKFEPPATIRQKEISVEKAKRAYEQSLSANALKKQQIENDMRKVRMELEKSKNIEKTVQEIIEKFTITAPANGMVIYYRRPGREIVKIGSSISPWNPTVASLPDLSQMVSVTYVNELDISKIEVNQRVEIETDAVPGKIIEGKVVKIANIGEQIQNSDAKVFKVDIKLENPDNILKPAMTTKNNIVINEYENVCYLPLLAIFENEGKKYIYSKSGNRYEIETGEDNGINIIVKSELDINEAFYLTEPQNLEAFKTISLANSLSQNNKPNLNSTKK